MAIASSSRASISSDEERSPTKKHKSRKESDRTRSHRGSSKESRKGKARSDDEGSIVRGDHGRRSKDAWEKRKIVGPAESAFKYLYPTITIPIPPALIQDPHRAADELMDTLLMRYVPQLSGVLLSHRNVSFLHEHARIDSDGAYSIAPAGLTCLAWAPEIGMRLEGKIQLSTPSHVSLLVHGIFNASITSAHLPSSTDIIKSTKDTKYRWQEYDNDIDQVKMEEDASEDVDMVNGDYVEKSTGYWIDCESGERLGGSDGKITFTVVGMTVVNHMLSLFGSLLRKPFSIDAPTCIPSLVTTTTAAERQRRVHFQEETQSHPFTFPHNAENEEDEGDSDDDDESEIPASNAVSRPAEVIKEASSKKSKKRSKIGPKREGEVSGSESETEIKREKKKRRKT